jgi:inner membrane protein
MKIEINENGKWQNSLTLKMVILAVLGLFLLIPLEMIKSVIKERQRNSEDIRKEISFQWSGAQTISGPVLNIPVLINSQDKESGETKSVFHILPEKLDITGNVDTEKRHRSIYQAVVYTSDLNISGEFVIPGITSAEIKSVLWNEAYISIGISDNRGLKGMVEMKINDTVPEAVPGVRDADLFASGITFVMPVKPGSGNIPFSTKIKLSGSESIRFVPLGKTTTVSLTSPWTAPGFIGNFLPAERNINKSGFKADWLVTNLNRNFPQSWIGRDYSVDSESFGTDFIIQNDHYQKSLRSAKYGILFIALTFLALIFIEFSFREKIHVFHYLLLSLALILFFSLLNSLSEYTGFTAAYLISSLSTILLILFFVRSLMENKRHVLIITGMLLFLYAFIFVLLTLNDYAYIAGNIGLFVLLAITMRLSLKLKDASPHGGGELK